MTRRVLGKSEDFFERILKCKGCKLLTWNCLDDCPNADSIFSHGRHFKMIQMIHNPGCGFKDFLFSPLLGEMIQFDRYCSTGLKPPTSNEYAKYAVRFSDVPSCLALVQLGLFLGTFYLFLDTVGLDDDDDDDDDDEEEEEEEEVTISEPHFPKRTKIFSQNLPTSGLSESGDLQLGTKKMDFRPRVNFF